MESKSYVLLFYLLLIFSVKDIFGKPFLKFQKLKAAYEKTDNHFTRELLDKYDSYILLYFKEDCIYSKGFHNNQRDNIYYIINRYDNIKLKCKEALFISKDFGIEIHFNKSLTILNYFFSINYDQNMKYLKSIDFSNFDSSCITDISKLFSGCNSVETINLTNFNASRITKMSSLFSGFSSLKSIDLSNFDSSRVTDISSMFKDVPH